MTGPSKSKNIFIILLIISSFLLNHTYVLAQNKNPINNLTSQIRAKLKQYPSLFCGVYIKPSWTKDIININGDYIFPAASLIKIPIAVALLLKIDKKEATWDKVLILKPRHRAKGAGLLKKEKSGTKITVKEAFKLMLTISDNTATNMIIDYLGGISATNNQISKLDLKNTTLSNWIGNVYGINKTSPHDLATILDKALEGNLLSAKSRKTFKKTLLHVKNTSLVKKGIGRYTKFAHKTGTIGIAIGDAGIIYRPWRKKITTAIIVKRPFNSLQGKKIILEMSEIIHDELM